jgi:hypothetical protein
MKKILISVVTVAAVAGFTTQAFADTITQSGTVGATCSITVLNGTLPTNAGLVNSIQSSADGQIKTKCSSATSKLTVSLGAHVAGVDDPGLQPLTREFNLLGGTEAYAAGGSAGFTSPGFGAATLNYINLSNNFVDNFSTLSVKTKVAAPAGQFLAGSTTPYKVRVIATAAP